MPFKQVSETQLLRQAEVVENCTLLTEKAESELKGRIERIKKKTFFSRVVVLFYFILCSNTRVAIANGLEAGNELV